MRCTSRSLETQRGGGGTHLTTCVLVMRCSSRSLETHTEEKGGGGGGGGTHLTTCVLVMRCSSRLLETHTEEGGGPPHHSCPCEEVFLSVAGDTDRGEEGGWGGGGHLTTRVLVMRYMYSSRLLEARGSLPAFPGQFVLVTNKVVLNSIQFNKSLLSSGRNSFVASEIITMLNLTTFTIPIT